MALARRQPALDDGLSKKHDLPLYEHSWKSNSRMPTWMGFRKRRIIYAILALCAVYLFIKHLPTDVPPVADRIDSRTGFGQGRPKLPAHPKYTPSNGGPVQTKKEIPELYDGPVKFYNLANSLRAHLRHESYGKSSVLFTLHDLKSASTLVPLACEMGTYDRNDVHVAIMTRNEAEVDAIMDVNGITLLNCPITIHDARPDYSRLSTPARRALAIKSGLGHLLLALQPQVIVTDASHVVDAEFIAALHERANSAHVPVAMLPPGALNSMSWISGLIAGSLAQLDHSQIDILIQAHSQSAGAVIKLLQSIHNANYEGVGYPRITIELPAKVDPFLLRFIDGYRWPPSSQISESLLIVRRRLDISPLSPAMASLRYLESFFPATPLSSHVLVLSPDVELSPNYLHYLTFMLLEYRYGPSSTRISRHLMGISLELPQKRLDGQSDFWSFDQEPEGLFLMSQSPGSNAVLYFGEKWSEFQAYLQRRLERDARLENIIAGHNEKVSQHYPAWLSLALEFMQARGYYLLFPAFSHGEDANLITVHQELHQKPEEYAPIKKESVVKQKPWVAKGDVLTGDEESKRTQRHEQTSQLLSLQTMLSVKTSITGRVKLPNDLDMPIYSYSGVMRGWQECLLATLDYSEAVALELGGCKTLEDRDEKKMDTIDYMFCDKLE